MVDGTYTCALNPKSKYYGYFSRSKNCESYPNCLCDRQCGPFVNNRYETSSQRCSMLIERLLTFSLFAPT